VELQSTEAAAAAAPAPSAAPQRRPPTSARTPPTAGTGARTTFTAVVPGTITTTSPLAIRAALLFTPPASAFVLPPRSSDISALQGQRVVADGEERMFLHIDG
jgi:hypothetical protein